MPIQAERVTAYAAQLLTIFFSYLLALLPQNILFDIEIDSNLQILQDSELN